MKSSGVELAIWVLLPSILGQNQPEGYALLGRAVV